MQKTEFKATTFLLLTSITSMQVEKIKTSFIKVQYNYSNNNSFCSNFSIKLCSNYIVL